MPMKRTIIWRRRLALTAAALLILLIPGCGTHAAGDTSTESPKVTSKSEALKTVRIGAVDDNGVLNDNARIAQAKGFFEEELKIAGYKPEYISFGWGGQPLNEALTAGEIDVTMSDNMSQLILRASGVDLVAIASINSRIQNGVAVHADSAIRSMADMEGRRIIVPTGSTPELYFNNLVRHYGLDTDKIERINTVSDIVSVFAAKEADAVIYGLYTAYYMEEYGMGKTIEDTYDHPEWTSQSLVSGRRTYWLENPEAAKAIIRALDRAQKYAEETGRTNPDEVYAVLSKDELSQKINKRIYGYDTTFSYFKPVIDEEGLRKVDEVSQYLLDAEFISEKIAAADFVDTSYYEAVMRAMPPQ